MADRDKIIVRERLASIQLLAIWAAEKAAAGDYREVSAHLDDIEGDLAKLREALEPLVDWEDLTL